MWDNQAAAWYLAELELNHTITIAIKLYQAFGALVDKNLINLGFLSSSVIKILLHKFILKCENSHILILRISTCFIQEKSSQGN